jgi:hypothetical protein
MVLTCVLICCKSKKKSLSGNEEVSMDDFMESFETVKTPYTITDSIFMKDDNDSSVIGYEVFTKFVPDSVITKHFSKEDKPDLFPVVKLKTEKKESYLFCKAYTDVKEILYLLCFDKSNKFIASKVMFAYDENSDYEAIVTIDNKFTITVNRQHRSTEGELLYKKDAYVLNDAGGFTLILTESNDAVAKTVSIINPIDTLPRKRKFSGDYLIDKKNFISVRDGKNASTFLFFIHFEKDGGTCNGELKGEAKIKSPTTAQFQGNSDPCTINFSFKENAITMKEIEGCGNHRDIKCFFEGTFIKKKEVKPKAQADKKKKGK